MTRLDWAGVAAIIAIMGAVIYGTLYMMNCLGM